ncbi:MAG: DUF2269 domain-containing protein [Pseudomonadota bacterium]|nr:DUF2269 domain-containing protein [Pseudomonadota bacterium]
MDLYTGIKTLHIISSTILFGTGMGIAFFMFRSWFTDDIQEKLYATRNTVLADYLFTFPAVVWIQIQLKIMCIAASESGSELPERYNTLFKIWFFLGWPAFLGLVAVFYLMVAKPV